MLLVIGRTGCAIDRARLKSPPTKRIESKHALVELATRSAALRPPYVIVKPTVTVSVALAAAAQLRG